MKFDLVMAFLFLTSWKTESKDLWSLSSDAATQPDICCKCQVRVEMFCRRISTQEERPESVSWFPTHFFSSHCTSHWVKSFQIWQRQWLSSQIACFLFLIYGSTLWFAGCKAVQNVLRRASQCHSCSWRTSTSSEGHISTQDKQHPKQPQINLFLWASDKHFSLILIALSWLTCTEGFGTFVGKSCRRSWARLLVGQQVMHYIYRTWMVVDFCTNLLFLLFPEHTSTLFSRSFRSFSISNNKDLGNQHLFPLFARRMCRAPLPWWWSNRRLFGRYSFNCSGWQIDCSWKAFDRLGKYRWAMVGVVLQR